VLAVILLLMAAGFLDAGLQARDAGLAATQSTPTREAASFPHNKDKHKTLECSKCHALTPDEPDVKDLPGHVSCAPCHNLALEALTKPALFCGICHEAGPLSKSKPALFRFPKPRVPTDFGTDFSHPSHLKPMPRQPAVAGSVQEVSGQLLQTPRCTDCHKRVQAATRDIPEMTIETGHRTCFKCHGEQPVKPPSRNQCAQCHKLEGPHAPHLYNLVKAFRHEDHEFDIRPRKKKEYPLNKAPDYLCSDCHTAVVTADALDRIKLPDENKCAECHNGRLGLPDVLASDVLDTMRKR
jgi:hypothetical protein